MPLTSFALRFSDLVEIEEGCREDEEERAGRTIDWISARISSKCAKWIEDWERMQAAATEHDMGYKSRTPWWNEVRQCVEGDHIPSRLEGWNHPVASVCIPSLPNLDRMMRYFEPFTVVFAVSTMLPNPLQTLAQLHARPLQLPSWVDTTHLRYSLIIHPENSPLTNEECVDILLCLRLLTLAVKSHCVIQCRQKAVWITKLPAFTRSSLSAAAICPCPNPTSTVATHTPISTPVP